MSQSLGLASPTGNRKISTVSFAMHEPIPEDRVTSTYGRGEALDNKAMAFVHTNVINSISALSMLYDHPQDKERLDALIEHVTASLGDLGGEGSQDDGARHQQSFPRLGAQQMAGGSPLGAGGFNKTRRRTGR